MTWTYSLDPSSSDKDAVRFLIGDTCFDAQQLQDEEIDWVLTEEPNVYLAGARCASSISGLYAKKADKSVGDLRIKYTSIRDQYGSLAANLEARGAIRSAVAYAGGISKDDKEQVEEETDRVEPSFEMGMHDQEGELHEINRDPEDEI